MLGKWIGIILIWLTGLLPHLALSTQNAVKANPHFITSLQQRSYSSEIKTEKLVTSTTQYDSYLVSFGIVRALDTLGSVVGPLILFVLLYLLANNQLKYHYIFFIAAVPLILTFAVLMFFVREVPYTAKTTGSKLSLALPKHFYIFLAIIILFSLGNSSDTFLILRAQNVGVTLLAIPLVYALFNFIYASASIPLGSLSDRIGREKVILIGWVAYTLAYLGFGLAKSPVQVWLLFAFYGIYYATTEGVAKAYVADIVPVEYRGRAYGVYNSVIGLIALPASVAAGFLWDKIGPSAPFLFGATMSALAAIILFFFAFAKPHHVNITPSHVKN